MSGLLQINDTLPYLGFIRKSDTLNSSELLFRSDALSFIGLLTTYD